MKTAPSFALGDFEIYSKLDLAIRSAGKVYIYDFKTGKPTGEEADQVGCYALYATHRWACGPEGVGCYIVSLFPEFRQVAYPVTAESLAALSNSIRESYAAMKALVNEGNVAVEEDFAKRDDDRACAWCNFAELCKG